MKDKPSETTAPQSPREEQGLDYRTDPYMDIGSCQRCGAYHEYLKVKLCPCGGEVL